MNPTGVVVHDRAVCLEEVVAARRRSDHQRRKQATCHGLQEHIEYGVDEGGYCADIGRQVFEGDDIGGAEQRRTVASLESGKSIVYFGLPERLGQLTRTMPVKSRIGTQVIWIATFT